MPVRAVADLLLDEHPSIGGILIDCTVSETHSAETERSQYAVEDQADRFDHFANLPDGLELEGIISDVEPPSVLRPTSLNPFQTGRSRTAWEELKELKEKGDPFLVITSLDVYMDMCFASGRSLVATRSPDDDGRLRFSAQLVKYRVAYTTFQDAVAAGIADLAERASISGLQATREADPITRATSMGFVG
jgi:hypothetical protein